MDFRAPVPAPFIVAHRAGNDLDALAAARGLRVPLIEADLHLFAGRVEVRHLKTVGPLPILWDRWTLASPWAPRLLLDALLEAAGPAELMLDLKGRNAHLPVRVADAIADRDHAAPITVCARRWTLLEPLDGLDGVRVVHSVGNARQLAALRRRDEPLAGVSIHRRLLDPPTVRELRERADLVLSWPVDTAAQARQLAAWGVHGLITSRFAELSRVLWRDAAPAPVAA
jgi:glycerophosphoryl diester phosphodiesterase